MREPLARPELGQQHCRICPYAGWHRTHDGAAVYDTQAPDPWAAIGGGGAESPGVVELWTGFVCGNIIGASSILLLIKLYGHMPVNVAGALALGGGFLVAQISLALVYRQNLTLAQYAGIVVIATGIMMVTWGRTSEIVAMSPRSRGHSPQQKR